MKQKSSEMYKQSGQNFIKLVQHHIPVLLFTLFFLVILTQKPYENL